MSTTGPSEETILEQALTFDSAEARVAYLQGACGDNQELRTRVESLIKAHEAAGGFLPLRHSPVRRLQDAENHSDEGLGKVIGRYKLREKIGEGGCGVVYVAEQEEPMRRRVALKVIKLGMDTRSVVARFEAERQALAMMDHPNIAKVFDAGATESGRPYFVMELVCGVRITDYCDQHQLTTQQRLDLFIQVCQAVQHAHQKGIIHRDLKPSNILVTLHDGAPVPKVIDFGIAKATEVRLTDKTIYTELHQFIGTPAYMSPEQAQMNSQDIDTRSDIYSLGVLLYELLTGQTPFDGNKLMESGLDAMRRTIREKEPERPSTRLRQASLAISRSKLITPLSSLAADLDWIVMKCLEKDRDRRYETANGVAADILRHLNHELVVARPPSTAYRFAKMVRRNKLQFAAAAFAAAALLLAVAVSSWQAVKAKRAERNAKQQAEAARTVKDFITQQLLGRLHPFVVPSFSPNKRVLLEGVAQAVEGRFATQPLIEGEVRHALGEVFIAFRDSAPAAAELEKALGIRTRLLGREHPDTILTAAKLAEAYTGLARKTDAERLLGDAIAAARRSPNGLSRGMAEALYWRGYLLLQDQRAAEALAYLNEAIDVLRRTVDENDVKITEVRWSVASATQALGKWQEAGTLWEEGLRHSARLHGLEHPMTTSFLKGQAQLFLAQGQPEKAVPLLERIIAVQTRTIGPDDVLTLDAEDSLAWAYARRGNIDEATRRFANLYRRWSKLFPYAGAVNRCHDYARFFVQQRRFDEARSMFSQIRESLRVCNLDRPATFEQLVTATAAVDGWLAAAEVCRQNFDCFSDSLPVWLTKAWVFRYVGDEDRYRQVVREILPLAATVKSQGSQHLPIEIAGLGPVQFSAEEIQRLDSLMKGLEVALPGHPRNQQAWGYRAIGQMQLELGRLQQCLTALEKSALTQTSPDPYGLFIKAICLHRLGHPDEARAVFNQAVTAMKPLVPEPLSESEAFLPAWQIYQQLLMRREAQALLTGTHPNHEEHER